tara:strand:- start:58 stop:822 length:765 start_codon:yes stop_codon:yes gene_type:complete
MKILLVIIFLFFNTLTSSFWGPIGHRVVGEIAEQNISEKTKKEIAKILDGASLAYIAFYADEIKSDRKYDKYYSWHFINFDLDENYMDTPPSDKGDLYTAINKCIDVLKDISIDKETKAFHLKLLVHFIGDLHQPLHLGQEEDRGANRISVKWFGSNTNLHSVWDSKMIDGYKMSYSEMAYNLQKTRENNSKEFQREDLIKWIDEIHDYTQEIYKSLDDTNLGYAYQYNNFDTVKNMLSLGGYRLARVLDYIFN